MTKELKDYLHLYFGLPFFFVADSEDDFKKSHFHIDGYWIENWGIQCKLPLRHLSGISHKEVANLLSVYDTAIENANYRSPIFQIQYRDKNNEQQYKHAYLTQLSPDQFLYLIKQGFDLFGLIEAGLAISKPKMQ